MTDTIIDAISNRYRLRIHYDPGERVIEPHAFGRSRSGDLLMRAFQISGASASGHPHDWKLFRLDKAGHIEPTGDSFDGPRPQYRRNDSAMRGGIIAQL